MVHRLIIYGLLAICATWVFTAETQRTQREEIVIKLGKVSYIPYQDEYEKMLYPTVRITTPSGTGSGVVISYKLQVKSYESKPETSNLKPETFILTAAHVVGNESKVTIEFFTTENTKIDASVVITDTAKDLALLSFFHSISYTAHLAPRDYTPYLFTPVYAIGCSLGLTPRPSEGIISVIDKDNWEISAPVLPGNSGGPVYDGHTYEVIGIAVWVKVCQFQLVTTMAGIVPIQEVYRFLDNYEKLSKPGDAGR
ncbi:MAG: serine protease [Planctomycetota bacterium]